MASSPGGGGRKLPRGRRLTRGPDIRAAFKQGKRSGTAHMDVFHSTSPFSYARAGVIVPRHRHTAVERNLVKRRLREAVRREVLPRLDACGLNLDVLVRARREAYGVPYARLAADLIAWAERRCSGARSSS